MFPKSHLFLDILEGIVKRWHTNISPINSHLHIKSTKYSFQKYATFKKKKDKRFGISIYNNGIFAPISIHYPSTKFQFCCWIYPNLFHSSKTPISTFLSSDALKSYIKHRRKFNPRMEMKKGKGKRKPEELPGKMVQRSGKKWETHRLVWALKF